MRNLLAQQPNPDLTAMIENGKEISFRELAAAAGKIGRQLQGRKAAALMLPSTGKYISAFWGCLSSGTTVFPLNTQLTRHEILPLLKYARISAVITTKKFRHIFDDSGLEVFLFEELLTDTPAIPLPMVSKRKDCTAVLLSTSGTAGSPKIVRLTENSIESCVAGYLESIRFKRNSRVFLSTPFSSVQGLMVITACLTLSIPLVVQGGVFTLDSFFRSVEKHSVTHYEGSATPVFLLDKISGREIPYNLQSLGFFGFGGSPISGEIIRRVSAAYPQWGFHQGYGMTEASPLIAKHPAYIPLSFEKAGSVGRAIKGMEIYILDGETITQLPYKKGEILTRGANVMKGYLFSPAETKLALKDGFLRTGDIGYLDRDGFLYICGRKKNMIIVRGFKICPEEVENCILESSLAADCRVYSHFDEQGNESVWADIVPASGTACTADIKNHCADCLAPYKCPAKYIICPFIEKNISGKTLRRKAYDCP